MAHSYLNQLNDIQKNAVTNTEGPALVIAAAGSGKTRVLTYRIAHLLAKGIPAYQILALTFTNKAAREMKIRIGNIVGQDIATQLWMGTFHSIFARILRYEAETLGYQSNYSIYDTTDSKNLIKTIIKDKKLDDKAYRPNQILGRISKAKNNLITPIAYSNNSQYINADRAQRVPALSDIYIQYTRRCKIAGAMDFDDLLLNTNILFRDNKDILKKYQDKFKYILVDEYQDTNFAQYLIIKKLAEIHRNVCVVGDDSQSIYSFRGAKIENILNFQKDYPDLSVFKLEHNYRSTKNIVAAANSVIDKNKMRLPKNAYTNNDDGEKVSLIKAITEVEEAYIIANSISDVKLNQQKRLTDFAILYRTNAQSRILEEALRKRNIPYAIYGGLSFFQRKEIKDLIAYLRLTVNHNDNEALKRIINYPARGIGATTMSKIEEAANYSAVPIWNVIANPGQFQLGLRSNTSNKIQQFIALISNFKKSVDENDAYDAAMEIASTSGMLGELYNDKTIEGRSRYENIQELLNGIKDFVANEFEEGRTVGLTEYIENVSLLTDSDTKKDADEDRVTLMTIHSAKGLEFKHVYIAGLEEGLFPSDMSVQSEGEVEEERRLFYVALTRAEEKATLTYCVSRYKWGIAEQKRPSRFLKEIDPNYIDNPIEAEQSFKSAVFSSNKQQGFSNFRKQTSPQQSTFKRKAQIKQIQTATPDPNFTPDPPEKIREKNKVLHQRFGRGEVIKIEGDENNKKAIVQFASGKKTLLLRFAKLKIIENNS